MEVRAPATLFTVVVLYGRSTDESPTFRSLVEQIDCSRGDRCLVYDNSPVSRIDSVPRHWTLFRDPANGGLTGAYGRALREAEATGCGWLLLLDQDTHLPAQFFSRLHASILTVDPNPDVVAIVPIVKSGQRQISPMVPKVGRETPFTLTDVIESDWLMPINSGACVRVEFIAQIGGFCGDFWLDYLDHWLFRTIAIRGKSLYVSGMVLQHDLSVANMNNGVSIERYANILAAERRFTNSYLPPLWRLVLVPRLLGRGVKHFVFTRDKRLARMMVAASFGQFFSLFRSPGVGDGPT